MKQDRIFKEHSGSSIFDLDNYLRNGYFIISINYNKITDTVDYHLRRNILSILVKNFRIKLK